MSQERRKHTPEFAQVNGTATKVLEPSVKSRMEGIRHRSL